MNNIKLHNGLDIPNIGFGVFRVKEGEEVESAVISAIHTGYRHIDTAMIYQNEEGVGMAIKNCGIPREQLFITTKLWNLDQGYESTLKAIEVSLEKLGLDYVDLYLVHWPTASVEPNEAGTSYMSLNKRKETWRGMEDIYKSGKAKAIGVSNYTIGHLEEMKTYATVLPMVNQIEFHPFLYQKDLLDYCNQNKIVVEAHSPLAPSVDPKSVGHENPNIEEIAKKHGKTKTQILIRWAIEHGVIPLPKSVHIERIKENLNVFDFSLDVEDMNLLDSMNINLHVRRDPSVLD
ncbi:MAG: aldo/keto reductase [Candidatus Paceibacterota bacterium]